MKLLIVTQKVDKDDAILGFFHRWLMEFAKRVDSLIVVCLEEGRHELPENVRVYSLGKEKGYSRLRYIARFYSLVLGLRKEYDTVFVHMNPEYVVLAGDLWHILGKKVGLWYVHREVNLKLVLAESIADVIFTSSPESFQLKSKKVRYLGHGIDIDKFPLVPSTFSEPVRLLHLGRVSKIKNIDTILRAAKILTDTGVRIESIDVAGAPITHDDREYEAELKSLAEELGIAEKVRWNYAHSDAEVFTPESISINAAPTGGMDKAVLGSLAAEKPTFAQNEAFRDVYGESAHVFMYDGSAENLAEKIEAFLKRDDRAEIVRTLSERVRAEYTVEAMVEKIVKHLA